MMDHPFITDIVEAYYNEQVKVLSLVTPLYEGGEVMDQVIDEDKKPDERCIARSVY
jgi:hypothetical protein